MFKINKIFLVYGKEDEIESTITMDTTIKRIHDDLKKKKDCWISYVEHRFSIIFNVSKSTHRHSLEKRVRSALDFRLGHSAESVPFSVQSDHP